MFSKSKEDLPPIPAEEDSNDLSALAVWRAVHKRRALAITVGLTVLLAVVFYTLGTTRIYRATTLVQIDPKAPRPLGNDVQDVVDMGTGNFWSNKEYYETQFTIIRSKRVTMAVVQELGLQHDAAFLANAPPDREVPPQEVSLDQAADVLESRLTVTPVKESRLVNIMIDDADPSRAQKVLATLVDTYVEQNVTHTVTSTSSAVDWLRGQLKTLRGDLESSELALYSYKQKQNLLSVSIDDQSNMLRNEMQKLNESLTNIRAEREAVAARKAELDKISVTDPSDLPATELLESPLLQKLRTDYIAAKTDHDALVGTGKGENHPDVRAATSRIATAKDALLKEVKNIKGALASHLSAVSRQAIGVSKLLDDAQKKALELNRLEIDYKRLARTKENNEKLYSMVQERTKESELTLMMRVNNIRVIDRPLQPRDPVRPRIPLNLGLGALTGLLLGVGAAVARELLDRSLKSPEDVERELNVTLLGLLPQISDTVSGTRQVYAKRQRRRKSEVAGELPVELLAHQHPTSGMAEAARALRTNLLFMSPDNPYGMLAVTSAGPSEGKTTVACSIAIVMAQAGQRVLLLDCDMRRPRLHRIFKTPNDRGVTTALLDLNSLDEAIVASEVPNLSVLPSGPLPPNPADLLHSAAFTNLLAKIRERFDRIVIDTPPVVPVTDAAVLSTKVDGMVLVVRNLTTTKDMARQATRALRDVGAPLVGAVMNAFDSRRGSYGYYQYYYWREDYPPDPRAAESNV